MKEKFVLYGHPIIPISRIIEVFKIIFYSGCYIRVQRKVAKKQEEDNTAPRWSDRSKLHCVSDSSEWTSNWRHRDSLNTVYDSEAQCYLSRSDHRGAVLPGTFYILYDRYFWTSGGSRVTVKFITRAVQEPSFNRRV